ncbi:hypothetical protein MTBBW1_1340009 [Desulfamplus magnetovallimortis]|uniref:Uncharacterized protein n=1 Tax=Desulfamplus magnetovallimortis TaxID=1246637 RepID=A0A1W1H7M5_9BACT|nr:hypothetical protein MTBBW1_1340009 [Desulfamplus magnetovallimortis]
MRDIVSIPSNRGSVSDVCSLLPLSQIVNSNVSIPSNRGSVSDKTLNECAEILNIESQSPLIGAVFLTKKNMNFSQKIPRGVSIPSNRGSVSDITRGMVSHCGML